MYTEKQKLNIAALVLGIIGIVLFLLQKMNIIKIKALNYIGKTLIAIGICLIAISNIIT
jgi:uncharacterized membrane protein (Fun14 family)